MHSPRTDPDCPMKMTAADVNLAVAALQMMDVLERRFESPDCSQFVKGVWILLQQRH